MTFATCLLISLVLWAVGHHGAGVMANPNEPRPHYLQPPRALRILLGMPKGNQELPAKPIYRTGLFLMVAGEVSLILALLLKDNNWFISANGTAVYFLGGPLISYLISSLLLRIYPYPNKQGADLDRQR